MRACDWSDAFAQLMHKSLISVHSRFKGHWDEKIKQTAIALDCIFQNASIKQLTTTIPPVPVKFKETATTDQLSFDSKGN